VFDTSYHSLRGQGLEIGRLPPGGERGIGVGSLDMTQVLSGIIKEKGDNGGGNGIGGGLRFDDILYSQ